MNRDKLRLYSRMDIGIACLLFLFTALYIGAVHAESDLNVVASGVDDVTKTGPHMAYIVLAKNEEREERNQKDREEKSKKDREERSKKDREERSKKDREERSKTDDDDDAVPPTATDNTIAAHDRSSPQYNRNCSDCHADIHTGQTLDPLIPDAHVAMLLFAPGETDSNDQCTWCHRSVDLVQAAGSPLVMPNSIRKRIDPRLCTMCHGPGGPAKQFYPVNLSSLQLDGSALYDLTCSGCHKVLADSEVEGESAAEIQKKINENEGGMGPLAVLNTEQIQTIAVALGGDPMPLPPPTDGVALYTQNCASCHGGLTNSDKLGASAALIQSAIDSNTGGMGSLSGLTPQLPAIAAALAL